MMKCTKCLNEISQNLSHRKKDLVTLEAAAASIPVAASRRMLKSRSDDAIERVLAVQIQGVPALYLTVLQGSA